MTLEIEPAVRAIAEAILIGFIIGAERESSQGEGHPGVRDFVLIALVGALCGLAGNPWLPAAGLLSVTALLGFFYMRGAERTGMTTEAAAVVVFCLGWLVTTPLNRLGVGVGVVVAALLEAKRFLHKLVRETITEREFDDTLRFLAIIFIVYPILPEGAYGPYDFLVPRQIWAFVILICSVSYAGYFLEKFLGARRGLRLTGVLGGLVSSTAATASLARSTREAPENLALSTQAAVLANAAQFPRLLLILWIMNPELCRQLVTPLAGMTVAGALAGLWAGRSAAETSGLQRLALRNPFQLAQALRFGALFMLIVFASKAAAEAFGVAGLFWTSALGGSVDADAVAVSLAGMVAAGSVQLHVASGAVLLALVANAAVKTGIALAGGEPRFARRLAGAFLAMFSVGAGLWWLA